MSSALPRCVLWDMDGTLVDTEPYWMQAETALVESFGGSWSHEQALGLVGQGLQTSAAILQDAGVALSIPEIIDTLTDQVTRMLAERGSPFRPGAVELLTALTDAGVRCALVTMSLRRMAEQVISPIASRFEAVIAGDDIARPKPFPDAYLQACRTLGNHPGEAVAIEDSPAGVRAAVSAGVTTIAVPLMVSLVGVGAHTLWPTLADRTPEDIAAVYAAHRPGETA